MTVLLRELEQRLEREPDNLPLRVTLAGKLREANRADDAVEHYRKVAIAYRSQGRAQQALAVCKSILELAPDDIAIHALVADLEKRVAPVHADDGGVDVEFSEPEIPAIRNVPSLVPRDPVIDALVPDLDPDTESDDATSPIDISRRAPVIKVVVPAPAGTRGARAPSPAPPIRKSATFETETPLPKPIPYHIADPTSAKARVVLVDDDVDTRPGPNARPPSEPGTAGLAQAARRISGMISNPSSPDLHARASTQPPSPATADPIDLDDVPTPVPDWAGHVTRPGSDASRAGRASAPEISDDEDLTSPLEKLEAAPVGNAFFAALPAAKREAALARCTQRSVAAGTTLVRLGETGHPLILVVSGLLEVRHDRGAAGTVALDSVEAGDHIGEAALLARSPAPANIVAVVDSEILALPPHALFELAGAYPALWAALKDSAERRTRQYERILRAGG